VDDQKRSIKKYSSGMYWMCFSRIVHHGTAGQAEVGVALEGAGSHQLCLAIQRNRSWKKHRTSIINLSRRSLSILPHSLRMVSINT
jgi:hypothetical protein